MEFLGAIFTMEDQNKMANPTLEAARQGKLSPLEAVKLVNQEIGGITRAIWNPGAGNYKILNHNHALALPTRGATKGQLKALQEIATLAYWQAQQNKSQSPGEIHLGKGCSTKHYKPGFNDYLQATLEKYQN